LISDIRLHDIRFPIGWGIFDIRSVWGQKYLFLGAKMNDIFNEVNEAFVHNASIRKFRLPANIIWPQVVAKLYWGKTGHAPNNYPKFLAMKYKGSKN
jgi:hypothetical protein